MSTLKILDTQGRVEQVGIDFGTSKVVVHWTDKRHIAIKVGGHWEWSRVGEQTYYPASITIFEVRSWDGDPWEPGDPPRSVSCTELVDVPVKPFADRHKQTRLR